MCSTVAGIQSGQYDQNGNRQRDEQRTLNGQQRFAETAEGIARAGRAHPGSACDESGSQQNPEPNPKLDSLQRLAAVLGVTVGELLSEPAAKGRKAK
jgi:hypothetical protein